jgi:hypothetical protein
MHRPGKIWDRSDERIAWLLDDAWPETASMVEARVSPQDDFLVPGVLRGLPARYDWPVSRARFPAAPQTLARHWAMRRVAKAPGGIRQRAYLRRDRSIAHKLAAAIDYRARHLVIAQSWLPWLDEAGALGGRTFDVLMSRYPLAEVHRLLDEAAAELGRSATIADFRADKALVEREMGLLQRARRIVTPHHGIAAMFPATAQLLSWHRPARQHLAPGSRVAFLGPTIARQRPDIACRFAAGLDEPLVVLGPILEPLWDDTVIEQRAMGPGWLDGIGAILHPATMTHQPRELLQALANGVQVYATATCGLAPADYLPLASFALAQGASSLVTAATAG